MLLLETQHSIAELATSHKAVGMHNTGQLVVGGQGYKAAELAFDIDLHEPEDIDPFSLVGMMSGEPQVTEVMPEKSLDVNVILHRDPMEDEKEKGGHADEIFWARKTLMHAVGQAITSSLLYNDRARFYVVGQRDPDLIGREGIYIPETEDPVDASEAISKLCTGGLNIVMGTFARLRLENTPKGTFKTTVGVKTNHILDRKLGRNMGEWPTGDPEMPIVNTNDQGVIKKRMSDDLIAYHNLQERRHKEIVTRSEATGIKMAEAVFDKTVEPHYFDTGVTDRSLAKAIKRVAR
jgi:hypothetical protein